MNIFCPGGYTYKNKGDAALVICMLAELERVFPHSHVTICSDSPDLDSKMYGIDVLPPVFGELLESDIHRPDSNSLGDYFRAFYDRHVGWRHRRLARQGSNYHGFVNVLVTRIRFHFFLVRLWLGTRLFPRWHHLFVPRAIKAVVASANKADAIVFVPGGYLIAPHDQHIYWLRHVAAIFMARWLGKPTFFFACTIGPFHGAYNTWLARTVLNSKQIFFLREQSSKTAIEKIAPSAESILSADVAFLLPTCSPARTAALHAQYIGDTAGLKIGVSVRDYRFPGASNPDERREVYFDSIARTADHFIEKYDATVFFVPQVLSDEVSDLEISEIVANKVARKSSIRVIHEDLAPSDLKGLYSLFDMFVGVRMHANIFALSTEVPTVAIAYEPKTLGIMQQLELDRFAISIRDLTPEVLISITEDLHANLSVIRIGLSEGLQKMRAASMQTASMIKLRMENLEQI